MQLKRYTDYSLRTLIYLGLCRDRLANKAEIAEAFGISTNHLAKVIHQLGSAGYIETIRGKGGGIRLAHEPDQLHIGEVVRKMEGNFEIVKCHTPVCPIVPSCLLRGVLNEAVDAFMEVLDRFTLQDLLIDTGQLQQLLNLNKVEELIRQ